MTLHENMICDLITQSVGSSQAPHQSTLHEPAAQRTSKHHTVDSRPQNNLPSRAPPPKRLQGCKHLPAKPHLCQHVCCVWTTRENIYTNDKSRTTRLHVSRQANHYKKLVAAGASLQVVVTIASLLVARI